MLHRTLVMDLNLDFWMRENKGNDVEKIKFVLFSLSASSPFRFPILLQFKNRNNVHNGNDFALSLSEILKFGQNFHGKKFKMDTNDIRTVHIQRILHPNRM